MTIDKEQHPPKVCVTTKCQTLRGNGRGVRGKDADESQADKFAERSVSVFVLFFFSVADIYRIT